MEGFPAMNTTTEEPPKLDFLHDQRAYMVKMLASAIFREIQDIIPAEIDREVYGRIQDALYRNGVLLTTDDERAKLGLEPRDSQGWTYSERVQAKDRYIEAMASLQMTIVKPD
jgi:hypothetical protein